MSVRKLVVRRLEPGERARLREIRLAALKESPEKFGETLAEAEQRTEEGWESYLSSVTQVGGAAAFLAELDGVTVGMVFVLHGSEPRIARLGGMWVAPGARRLGIGSALIEAVYGWALENRKAVIRLWAFPDSAGETLYRARGFAPLGHRKAFPGDPTREVSEFELAIDPSQTPRLST